MTAVGVKNIFGWQSEKSWAALSNKYEKNGLNREYPFATLHNVSHIAGYIPGVCVISGLATTILSLLGLLFKNLDNDEKTYLKGMAIRGVAEMLHLGVILLVADATAQFLRREKPIRIPDSFSDGFKIGLGFPNVAPEKQVNPDENPISVKYQWHWQIAGYLPITSLVVGIVHILAGITNYRNSSKDLDKGYYAAMTARGVAEFLQLGLLLFCIDGTAELTRLAISKFSNNQQKEKK